MKLSARKRIQLAWTVAILCDALQIGLFPISTWLDAPVDLLVMGILWSLLGWHWALLPSFVFELLPIAELAPTWTLATWIIVRKLKTEMPTPLPGTLSDRSSRE
jgi:hypothetical protein